MAESAGFARFSSCWKGFGFRGKEAQPHLRALLAWGNRGFALSNDPQTRIHLEAFFIAIASAVDKLLKNKKSVKGGFSDLPFDSKKA
jgi:hypothetical protein